MDDQGVVCPECGERNPPLLTICRQCGKPLSPPGHGRPPQPDGDVMALLGQALLDQRDGEDFDDALLRAAKTLYPDRWSEVFASASQQVAEQASRDGTSKREAAQALHQGAPPAARPIGEVRGTVGTATVELRRTSRVELSAERLAQLPPDARAEVDKALAAEGRTPVQEAAKEEPEETLSLEVGSTEDGLSGEQLQSLRDALERGVSLDQISIERPSSSPRKGCLGIALVLALPLLGLLVAIILRC